MLCMLNRGTDMKKKYRQYYMNINSGEEFFIEIDNSDEILPALKHKPQYVREPDNWECYDQEEINKDYWKSAKS